MERPDKIAAIVSAIQDDATLLKLLRLLVSNNISNVPDANLDMVMQVLGISQ